MDDLDLAGRSVSPEIAIAIEARALLGRHRLEVPADHRKKIFDGPSPSRHPSRFELLELCIGMTLADFLKDIHEALRLNGSQTHAPTSHDQVVH